VPTRHLNPKTIRQVPMFATLNDEDIEMLTQQVQHEYYTAGTMLFYQNDPGGVMYIVESGEVDLFVTDRARTEVSLLKVEAGGVFGELSPLDNQPRSASARAITEVELLVLSRDALIAVVYMKPGLAFHMLEMLAARLRATNALVQERIVPNANEVIDIKLTLGDRLSDFFTNASGNIYFVAFSLVWFTVWILLNVRLIPGFEPFDPFPFGLLTMIVSLEMVFLSLFILIKQARQAANDKIRNDIEYEINVRAEIGVRGISESVETLEQRLMQRITQLERNLPRLIDTEPNHISSRETAVTGTNVSSVVPPA